MNAPRIASFIRKCGLAVCRLAKPFTEESGAVKTVSVLMKEAQWSEKLESITDREMASIVARVFDFPWGTEKSAVIGEVVDRLSRSALGSNRLEDNGRRIFGIALNVRLLPGMACDGCHSIGYVCDRSRLCLYCLGLKVSVEARRQKLSRTLRGHFATLATEVREKIRQFNQKP